MTARATTNSTRTPYSRPVFGALYKRLKMEARLQAKAQAHREAIAMTHTATTDTMNQPYRPIPILSDLYNRKMETARVQAEAHQQAAAMQRQQQEDAIHRQKAQARRQDTAAKWQAEARRQQQRR